MIGSGTYVGGLTGRHYLNIVIEDSYWDPATTAQATNIDGEPLSTAEFGDAANFENWHFAPAADAIWVMGVDDQGNARPKLAWEG